MDPLRLVRDPGRLAALCRAGLLDSAPEESFVTRLAALPVVQADPMQMRQLLRNLISNALKFRREGVAPVVELSAAPGGGETVEIRVADNGIGFDPRFADKIFAPLERLHGRKQYEGTGIGLAICRKIAERHGGAIVARSVPGEGLVLSVELPLSPRARESWNG